MTMATQTQPGPDPPRQGHLPQRGEPVRGDDVAVRLRGAEAEPRSRPLQGPPLAREADHRERSHRARQRRGGGLHRLPGALQHLPRPCQGRHPLRHQRDPGRGQGAGRLDDLEVRGGQHPLRRVQGRGRLRSLPPLQRGAGADHPALHLRHHRYAGPRLRRAGARRQHQRAGHGLDHGHLLHAQAPHRHRGRDRQAGRDGRLAGPARSDRPGLHAGDPGGAQATPHADRGNPGRDPGVRQRGVDRRRS